MTAPPISSPQPAAGVALVTGAADRIGAVMAKSLAAAGWKVVIHYRSQAAKAEQVRDEIEALGGAAALVRADLADRGERATLIAEAAKAFGPMTALVNNASSYARDSIFDLEAALWDRHFAVHAEAPLFLARDFAAQLPDGAGGNIVNIIDERLLHLSPAYMSYTLSKSVLWTATRTMAQALAPRIRVNAIGPGPTLRPHGAPEEQWSEAQRRLPLGRGATPGEIAEGLLFILSARSMTGQMLVLDGGEHLEFPEWRKPTPRRS